MGRVDEATGEPLLGLRLSGVIALGCVLLGDLNAVATWVTAFFLTTYGALNAVAALKAVLDSYKAIRLNGSSDELGSIIGKSGATIQGLTKDSGAQIKVDRKTGTIDISGPADNVAKAKDAVLHENPEAGIRIVIGLIFRGKPMDNTPSHLGFFDAELAPFLGELLIRFLKPIEQFLQLFGRTRGFRQENDLG